MAPRRDGSGGSSSSGGGGGGGDDGESPADIVLKVQIACAAWLLAAAVIASLLVLSRSWLNRNGKRNKSRLAIFIFCLVSIIISRAIFIAEAVLVLQDSYDYSTPSGSFTYPIVTVLFSDIATVLFFGLVLVAITRLNPHVHHERTAFEMSSFSLLVVLSALLLTTWAMLTRDVLKVYHQDSSGYTARATRLGLELTIQVIAVLFATAMLVNSLRPSSVGLRFKLYLSHLRFTAFATWAHAFIYLAIACTGFFRTQYYDDTKQITTSALGAASDVVWVFMIWGMFRLALDAHFIYGPGVAHNNNSDLQQTGHIGTF